jgi:hypothetical protein
MEPAITTQLTPGAQPTATELDSTIRAQTIAASDLARRVKMAEIKPIEVVDQHAVVTSQDGRRRLPPTSVLAQICLMCSDNLALRRMNSLVSIR